MFVEEIVSKPRIIGERKFIDKTVKSKFKKGEVEITTTYIDGKPLIKEFMLSDKNFLKYIWKSKKHNVREEYVQKINFQA